MKNRLCCLDVLRGLDMMFLTVVAPLLWGGDAVWGLPECVKFQLTHPWEGFTCWDIIMPMFIFMCGAAIPLSLERRLERSGGRPDGSYWRHVFGRVAMLWVLGMLVQGHLASLDLLEIRPYNNTLQTIAFGYLVCAAAVCVPSRAFRLALPIACFVLYGVLLHAFGDYTMTGNFAEKVEQATLTALLPAGSKAIHEIGVLGYLPDLTTLGEIHYTWVLTSLMFVFMTFAGYFATKILMSGATQREKALRLLAYGASLLILGWVLTFCGVRMVKHIFTVSFTAQAMGWCILLLDALYVLTDILKFRRGLYLPVLFGQFALTAYLIEEFFKPTARTFAAQLLSGVPNVLGTERFQPLVLAAAVVVEIVVVLRIRRAIRENREVGK